MENTEKMTPPLTTTMCCSRCGREKERNDDEDDDDDECAFCVFRVSAASDVENVVSDVVFRREFERAREDEEMRGASSWRAALDRQTQLERRARECAREDAVDWCAYVYEIEANLEYANAVVLQWNDISLGGESSTGDNAVVCADNDVSSVQQQQKQKQHHSCVVEDEQFDEQLPLRFNSSREAFNLRAYHTWVI